jgi:VCBS repeat-containing protein
MLGAQKYHFLGVNTADNTGDPFSLSWPWGDYAGLDGDELSYITGALTTHADADLTFVFGHHPVTDTGIADDTWLYYGHQQFVSALDAYRASTYSYGHTHNASQVLFKGDGYTGAMSGDGVHYYNVASLGKSSSNNYSIVAIDCNAVSSVTKTVGPWPVVLITAPVGRYVGSVVNPYAYTVPAASTNTIRALVFDAATITQVRFRIDGAIGWFAMSRVAGNPALWQGTWNAASASAGSHTIEVQATGTSTVSDTITVEVTAGASNQPPTATGDSYTTNYETALSVAAPGVLANDTDPESQALSAALVTGPAHGTVTLSANGSFTYTPTTTYSGTDSFTYKASDGVLDSAAAAVSITVRPASTADTVTILSATYNAKRKQLSVTATSSVQPNATLTVEGFGTMAYKAKTKTYVLTASAPTKPTTVTVTSSRGGIATALLM